MPSFDAGEIVRVPFPYIDRPVRQYRPALVVSNQTLGEDGTLIWVLMITSAANRPWRADVPVPATQTSGLPVDSRVRTAKIATIEAASAERIGTLPAGLMAEVTGQLRATIG